MYRYGLREEGEQKVKGEERATTKRLQSHTTGRETGQKLLTEYEMKQRNLRETLLRISGAIQVLEEVIAEADSEANGEVSQPDDSPADKEQQSEPAESGEEK